MTKRLQEAFDKASQLPAEEQDWFAAFMLQELESEHRWQELFASSQDALAKLAKEALAEHRAGKTRLLDPDAL
jgi:hypothetical protein